MTFEVRIVAIVTAHRSQPDASDYGLIEGELERFGQILCTLLSEILSESDVSVHSIRHRVKEKPSADRKIELNPVKYDSYGTLHDMLGVRIITHFPDEVDKAAEVIEREFTVDRDSSVDKRAMLDPDRFGYLSLHYVLSLSDTRQRLVEYRRFRERKFELQIRTILQHAWAEIEHDLGYKSAVAIPSQIRRKFSRLAGLLEVADEQFQELREQISNYEATAANEVSSRPSELEINQSTMLAFIETSETVATLDKAVSTYFRSTPERKVSRKYAERRVDSITIFGFQNIQDLEHTLVENREAILAFVGKWSDGEKHGPMPRGVSIFYLELVLIAKEISRDSGNSENLDGYFDMRDLRGDRRIKFQSRIQEAWNEARGQNTEG